MEIERDKVLDIRLSNGNEKVEFEDVEVLDLTEEHRSYLIARHGTFHLHPIPSMNDEDPLNWRISDKVIQLGMIAFHAFFTTFMAAGLIPSFTILSTKLKVSVTACSYLTSAQIIVLGFFPLIWSPIMAKYGRRQLLIVSTLGSMAFNIGCIFTTNYRALMICRLFSAFFISPAIAVGSGVVKDLTFSHQRGWWTGWWVLGVTLGTHFGPFLMGFVTYHTNDTKYTFVIFAAMNFLQFLGYLFFGKETIYNPDFYIKNSNSLFKIEVKSSAKLNVKEIFSPFKFLKDRRVVISAIAYSVAFSYANVACGVELTALFTELFEFNAQQIGLQFIGLMLGCIFGEQIGGWISDYWMVFCSNKKTERNIADRLWISYFGFFIAIIGLIVYGCVLNSIHDRKWRIGPIIGLFLASFGLQIVTTVLVTYSIDSNPSKASEIALCITTIRQSFGFVAPFYVPVMLNNMGILKTYCLLAGLVGAFGLIPMIVSHLIDKLKPQSFLSIRLICI